MDSQAAFLILAFLALTFLPAPFLGRYFYRALEGERTGRTAAQSAAPARARMDPGAEHRHQLRHQHQLAGL